MICSRTPPCADTMLLDFIGMRSSRLRCGKYLSFAVFLVFSVRLLFGQKRCRTKPPRFFRIFDSTFFRKMLQRFPEIFHKFSCFVSWEPETTENSSQIPENCQLSVPRQICRFHKSFLEGRKSKVWVLLLQPLVFSPRDVCHGKHCADLV